MLGMHAVHIKMAKPAVQEYWGNNAGSEGNTGAGTRWGIRMGSWGQLWQVGHEVDAVAEWLEHTQTCGHHDLSSIKVNRKNKFTTAMRLHPIGTEEATNVRSRARGEVKSVQRMSCAVDELAGRQ
jgi:hypothetical protein